VLADDAAAGRAYLEGGPALSPAQARRMLCESTVVVMLERGREVLAVGRKKRLATKAQRRALLRRDGGCARPGCPENRLERLHAHHMRHWLFGGRTDLTNLVLLCDADHGLVHDLDLVMTRRDGRLVVTAPDGRRVWGTADTAFTEGVAGLEAPIAADDDRFAGVHPIDEAIGRRPDAVGPADTAGRSDTARRADLVRPAGSRAAAIPAGAAPPARPRGTTRPGGTGRPGTRRRGPATTTPRGVRRGRNEPRRQRSAVPIGATLFPAGEPPLPEAFHVNGERMDLRYVVSVLLGNRDLIRRTAAEAGVDMGDDVAA
jgi:hypothetical protein